MQPAKMCFLILLAGLAACAGAMPVAAADDGFRALPRDSVEQQTYQRSRALALTLVREAQPTLGSRHRRLADPVLRELAGARFLASSTATSRQLCRDRRYSLFVRQARPHVIHICDEVRPHARSADPDAVARLAQAFVHEAVHLTGDLDECAAMDFELAVMRRTIGIRTQGSQISYGARCGRMGAR
jgi:hypothetical protein